MTESNKTVLGLDLGTNSLGWCVIDFINRHIIDAGVIRFDAGGCIYSKQGYVSTTAIRTQLRSTRRQHDRKKRKLSKILSYLNDNNLCPNLTKDEKEYFEQENDTYNDSFASWIKLNPYEIRTELIHNSLDMSVDENRYKLGRALYAISHYTGYISNRKTGTDKTDGAVADSIEKYNNSLVAQDIQFYGELFNNLNKKNLETVRICNENKITINKDTFKDSKIHAAGNFTDGNKIKEEIIHICKMQNLSASQIKEIVKLIFFRRPMKPQQKAKCIFEPNLSRCSSLHPEYELYNVLQLINNIYITDTATGEKRHLTEDERKIVMSCFEKTQKQIKFKTIIKTLSSYLGTKVSGSDDSTDETKYILNYSKDFVCPSYIFSAAIIQTFSVEFLNNTKEINKICDFFTKCGNSEQREKWLIKTFSDSYDYSVFKKIDSYTSTAPYSLKAIKNINRFLSQGFNLYSATILAKVPDLLIQTNQYDTQTIESLCAFCQSEDKIYPDTIKEYLEDNDIFIDANKLYLNRFEDFSEYNVTDGKTYLKPYQCSYNSPMLTRAMNVVRKLINELIKNNIIDKNTTIHIETSHEINNIVSKNAYTSIAKRKQKRNEEIRQKLIDRNLRTESNITDDDILKYSLADEQNWRCLYTNEQISPSDLFGVNPVFNIEHTIPRCLGGTYERYNLTIAKASYNQGIKKDSLPANLADSEIIQYNVLQVYKSKRESLKKQINKLKNDIQSGKCELSVVDSKRSTIIQLKEELKYYSDKINTFFIKTTDPGFAIRQASDNSLISKTARNYLKSVFKKVYPVNARYTYLVRRDFGWKSKDRDNNTHHMIDAAVIACVDQSLISKYMNSFRHKFIVPWDSFHKDVNDLCQKVNIVYLYKDTTFKQRNIKYTKDNKTVVRKSHGVRGQLHEQTALKKSQTREQAKTVNVRRHKNISKNPDKEYMIYNSGNNYGMCIDESGKKKLISMMDAARGYNNNQQVSDLMPNCRAVVRQGMHVILCTKEEYLNMSEEERQSQLRRVTMLCNTDIYYKNNIINEDKQKTKTKRFKLIENVDFKLTYTGKIIWLK